MKLSMTKKVLSVIAVLVVFFVSSVTNTEAAGIAQSPLNEVAVSSQLNTSTVFVQTQQQNENELHCGSIVVKTRAFGAGLMNSVNPVKISNQTVIDINPSEGCAVISWDTDTLSTSQIVFSEKNSPEDIIATTDTMGYEYQTVQNNSADTHHAMIISNLIPGKMYVYRVVSRLHPGAVPTTGEEFALYLPTSELDGSYSAAPLVVEENIIPVITETVDVISTPIVMTTKKVVVTETYTVATATEPVAILEEVTGITEKEAMEIAAIETPTATTTLAIEEPKIDINKVPAAVTSAIIPAVTEAESSSFLARFKNAFSFSRATTTEKVSKVGMPKILKEKKEVAATSAIAMIDAGKDIRKENINVGGFFQRNNFIIPSILVLLFIYLLQQIILPLFGILVQRPLVFWMFAVIISGILAGFLRYYKITLIMIALFLALLAFYLVKTASQEMKENEESKKIA